MRACEFISRGLCVAALAALPASAWAGKLVIENTSKQPISCTIDGYTKTTGDTVDRTTTISPGASVSIAVDPTRNHPGLSWAKCGSVTTRAMKITPTGPDTHLVLNGRQQRSLNVSLYPYIPTVPAGNFQGLISYVISRYQGQNPDVLLNVQMTEDVDIYTFSSLPAMFQSSGYDVVELDAVVLQYLAANNLINPATIQGEPPLPVAQQASTVDGVLWGVPSWLCMDFVYLANWEKSGHRKGAAASHTALPPPLTPGDLARLSKRRGAATQPFMLANYDGHWRLPSMYVNGYVEKYGIGAIAKAFDMSNGPDAGVMANLIALVHTCDNGGGNQCIDGTFHNAPNQDDTTFGQGGSDGLMDFSEQAFYVSLANPSLGYYVLPPTWGGAPLPLLFSDTFVTSAAACGPATACASDAAAFTTLMTSVPMKNFIVQSGDLSTGTPWRTLLVAGSAFYAQPAVQQNRIYAQVAPVLANAQPFPNNFSDAILTSMDNAICTSFKAQLPLYACKVSNPATGVTTVGRARPPH